MFNCQKLRDLRAKKFTQKVMAEKLGVSLRTYTSYENDGEKLKMEDLEKISEILEVHPGIFFEEYNEYVKNKFETGVNEDPARYNSSLNYLERLVRELKADIEYLREENRDNRKMLSGFIDNLDLKNSSKVS